MTAFLTCFIPRLTRHQIPQIQERAIWSGIAKGLAKLKGGDKWPELKAKLNEPKPPAPEHVPFSGPILNGRIKGKNGKWVKYEPGMETN